MPSMGDVAAAHSRIARLAAMTSVHRAFHWLHLHQPQLRQWQMEMTAIPAPPFGEGARAAWFLELFQTLGLTNVHLDESGNALAELAGPFDDSGSACVLLSAHLDTVFPTETNCSPVEAETRLLAPGICDNGAGLTGLLALAAALRFAKITPPLPIVFAANVGEEGEGDLRGMKHLFKDGSYSSRIAAVIALEGSGSSAVVTKALGSRRFRLTVTGPGGHSWSDAGAPNPILILSRVLVALSNVPLPATPRTTLNIGMISGGTSINSIPESTSALLDLRSTDPEELLATEILLREVCSGFVRDYEQTTVEISVDTIGNRPAASLPDDSPLLQTIRAVDRHLSLRTDLRIGSTDANLPLSLGVPAVAIGAGGSGGGIHTLQEWYDPSGRETALRRILLILLDTAQIATTTQATTGA